MEELQAVAEGVLFTADGDADRAGKNGGRQWLGDGREKWRTVLIRCSDPCDGDPLAEAIIQH
nr:hypothetical protein Iba_chr04aCG2160 [Ipomoea batatas]GMC89606.1 hypothetical protein Iba_chr04fCG0470 [Ipomoea batatas]GME07132.1 hypothetical protein Iba_scaffold5915CG0020 [Ipomoea batatas]